MFWTTGDRALARYWAYAILRLDDRLHRITRLDPREIGSTERDLRAALRQGWLLEAEHEARVERAYRTVSWSRVPVARTHLLLRDYYEGLTTIVQREQDGGLVGMVEVRRGPFYEGVLKLWLAEASERGLVLVDERTPFDPAGEETPEDAMDLDRRSA